MIIASLFTSLKTSKSLGCPKTSPQNGSISLGIFKIVDKGQRNKVFNILKLFFENAKGYFNEYRLNMLFKQHGIEVVDANIEMSINKASIAEPHYIMIAIIELEKYPEHVIQLFKEEEIA